MLWPEGFSNARCYLQAPLQILTLLVLFFFLHSHICLICSPTATRVAYWSDWVRVRLCSTPHYCSPLCKCHSELFTTIGPVSIGTGALGVNKSKSQLWTALNKLRDRRIAPGTTSNFLSLSPLCLWFCPSGSYLYLLQVSEDRKKVLSWLVGNAHGWARYWVVCFQEVPEGGRVGGLRAASSFACDGKPPCHIDSWALYRTTVPEKENQAIGEGGAWLFNLRVHQHSNSYGFREIWVVTVRIGSLTPGLLLRERTSARTSRGRRGKSKPTSAALGWSGWLACHLAMTSSGCSGAVASWERDPELSHKSEEEIKGLCPQDWHIWCDAKVG